MDRICALATLLLTILALSSAQYTPNLEPYPSETPSSQRRSQQTDFSRNGRVATTFLRSRRTTENGSFVPLPSPQPQWLDQRTYAPLLIRLGVSGVNWGPVASDCVAKSIASIARLPKEYVRPGSAVISTTDVEIPVTIYFARSDETYGSAVSVYGVSQVAMAPPVDPPRPKVHGFVEDVMDVVEVSERALLRLWRDEGVLPRSGVAKLECIKLNGPIVVRGTAMDVDEEDGKSDDGLGDEPAVGVGVWWIWTTVAVGVVAVATFVGWFLVKYRDGGRKRPAAVRTVSGTNAIEFTDVTQSSNQLEKSIKPVPKISVQPLQKPSAGRFVSKRSKPGTLSGGGVQPSKTQEPSADKIFSGGGGGGGGVSQEVKPKPPRSRPRPAWSSFESRPSLRQIDVGSEQGAPMPRSRSRAKSGGASKTPGTFARLGLSTNTSPAAGRYKPSSTSEHPTTDRKTVRLKTSPAPTKATRLHASPAAAPKPAPITTRNISSSPSALHPITPSDDNSKRPIQSGIMARISTLKP